MAAYFVFTFVFLLIYHVFHAHIIPMLSLVLRSKLFLLRDEMREFGRSNELSKKDQVILDAMDSFVCSTIAHYRDCHWWDVFNFNEHLEENQKAKRAINNLKKQIDKNDSLRDFDQKIGRVTMRLMTINSFFYLVPRLPLMVISYNYQTWKMKKRKASIEKEKRQKLQPIYSRESFLNFKLPEFNNYLTGMLRGLRL